MEKVDTTFGSRVAGRRRTLCRSQAWLAGEVCVSRRFLSKVENDRAAPSWETVQRLATALGVSLDFLAKGEG